MKYLKLFEAKNKRKTYREMSIEIFDKFKSLFDANIDPEIEDRFLSINDILPLSKSFSLKCKFDGKKENIGFNYYSSLLDSTSYRRIKAIYDRVLLNEGVEIDACFTYYSDNLVRYNNVKEEIIKEVEDLKESIESMGYVFKENITDISNDRQIVFNVIKKNIDISPILENPEYLELLPSGLIKSFSEFMMKYKVSEIDRANFAKILSETDWVSNQTQVNESYTDLGFTTSVDSITDDVIYFDNGLRLSHYHASDCCEYHWLDFTHIELDEFDGMQFDLSSDDFFERIPGYGIALKPLNGHPIRIPGYGSNNGYYSDNLTLILSDSDDQEVKTFDISDCQEISD